MSGEEKGKSWWQSLPGVLTGVTAIITAVAGLLVAINQTGWFSGSAPNSAPRDQNQAAAVHAESTASESSASGGTRKPSPSGGNMSVTLPQLRDYRLGDLVFTLLGASLSPRNSEAGTLSIQVRLLNNTNYPTNFWNQQFRLLIDDIPQAPSGDLNALVDGNAAKEGEVTFVVPQSTSTAKLRIQASDEKTDIPLAFVRS